MHENKIIQKTETYLGLLIIGSYDIIKKITIGWRIYNDKKMVMADTNQIDGTPGFQSVNHAINDAKKNIDELVKLHLI